MYTRILNRLKKAIQKEEITTEKKHSRERIATQDIADKYIADKEFPFLVSFSRTGSHWLRMLMELYFEKPSLKLLFFQTVAETESYTCFHTHYLELNVKANNVIYLYRDPVDTIYSQMSFHAQDMSDVELLDGWISLYGDHLNKWLLSDDFTHKKIVLRYENMVKDLTGEFKKLSDFFQDPFDEQKVNEIALKVSKEKIKEKTLHDPRVINLASNYSTSREKFRNKYGNKIYDDIFNKYPDLKQYFN